MEGLLGRLAAGAERFSGVEVGEGWWTLGPLLFMGVALLLSYPCMVGVYAILSVALDLVPQVWLPLLLLMGSLAWIMWVGLAVLGLTLKPSKSPRDARTRRGVQGNGRPTFSWTISFGRSGAKGRMSGAPAEEIAEDAVTLDERPPSLSERLSCAVVLSSALPLGAAAFLALFPPFFSVWLLSRGMARLAEGLRTVAVLAGFVLFLSGLCLQLCATF